MAPNNKKEEAARLARELCRLTAELVTAEVSPPLNTAGVNAPPLNATPPSSSPPSSSPFNASPPNKTPLSAAALNATAVDSTGMDSTGMDRIEETSPADFMADAITLALREQLDRVSAERETPTPHTTEVPSFARDNATPVDRRPVTDAEWEQLLGYKPHRFD